MNRASAVAVQVEAKKGISKEKYAVIARALATGGAKVKATEDRKKTVKKTGWYRRTEVMEPASTREAGWKGAEWGGVTVSWPQMRVVWWME